MFKFICLILFPMFLSAFEDIPPCYRDMQTTFFKPELVSQAISTRVGYYQQQNTWILITQELTRRSQNIPQIVKFKADQFRPSPLEFPFNAQLASQILFDTQYELFSSVLKSYGINDDTDITAMFNFIRGSQEPMLRQCLGLPPAP